MGDPISTTLLLKAAAPVASGFSALQQGKAAKRNAEINSFIGRTREIEYDTVARQELSDDLGSMRAVLGANSQAPNVGTFEVMSELRKVRDRERRIEMGGLRSQTADFRQQGRNAAARGRAGFIGGLVESGPSLFDYVTYQRRSG